MTTDRQQFVGMYDFQETLGKGHFSVVKQAQHVLSKQKVAIKVIEKAKLSVNELHHLHHEVRVMKEMAHPHIIRLYQVIDTVSRLYLILELGCGGDLYDHIMNHGKLQEALGRAYFRQVVSAVRYCHQMHIAHRDLKPENIVFCENEHGRIVVKITDFGLSNNFCPGKKMTTMCGSLSYTAPEVLLQDPYDGPAADRWSLGVILYMMVAGRLPFQDHNESVTTFKILDCKYLMPDDITTQCQDVISHLLVRNPTDRIELDDVMVHPWMSCPEESLSGSGYDGQTTPGGTAISAETHAGILRTMSMAGIDVSTVEKSLRENAYDYYSGTYYLLVERMQKDSCCAADHETTTDTSPTKSSGSQQNSPRLRRNVSMRERPSPPSNPIATPPSVRRASSQTSCGNGANIVTGKHTGSLRRPTADLSSLSTAAATTSSSGPQRIGVSLSAPMDTISERSDRLDLSASFPGGQATSWSRQSSGGSSSSVAHVSLYHNAMHRSFSVPEDDRYSESESTADTESTVDATDNYNATSPLSRQSSQVIISSVCVIS